MSDFRYAGGRTAESVQFLTEEIREFDKDYSQKTWEDYQRDRKLQKLMANQRASLLIAALCFLFNQDDPHNRMFDLDDID